MGQYLPWLKDCVRSTGLPWVDLGYIGHNHGPMADHIYGTICHHTAGPDPYPGARNDFPSVGIVRNGRAGLPGPLAQLGLGWNGTVYLISDGLSYHGGRGSWRGVSGNSRWIGIEAEDAGDGDWSPPQLEAYPVLAAALCDWLNVDAGWTCGHKEYAPARKIDPAGIDMDHFRAEVARLLANGYGDDMFSDADRALLHTVVNQLTGSGGGGVGPDPWDFPGFPVETYDGRVLNLTLYQAVERLVVKQLSKLDRDEPIDGPDDQWGTGLSTAARLRKVEDDVAEILALLKADR